MQTVDNAYVCVVEVYDWYANECDIEQATNGGIEGF